MTRRRRITLEATTILLVLLIPIPYLASPEWTIVVRDEAGHPLEGMLLRLSYQNYSVEGADHESELYTDPDGTATFPAHRSSAPLLRRCYYTVRTAMTLTHASFGPSAYVLVFGQGREGSINTPEGTVYFWTGKPDRISSTVVARLRDH